MTLGFSQYINGKSTYFPEKIWAGIKDHEVSVELSNYLNSPYSTGKSILDVKPKYHTIREDKNNRWQPGKQIHFVINNRTKNRLQFAPIIKVKSIQKIVIKPDCRFVEYEGTELIQSPVIVDNRSLKASEIKTLAINDGFDSVDDFFTWFNKGFTGKIIHWTNLNY
ncbi:hypothetical protein J1D01_10555 [Seonamhaeicola sp. NFXS20]|uniref:hypothetical protein n=1 Tax=Seonamhaeicola sp. NFXS20 TaxID=2816959 RepID=UPI003B8E3ABF